MPASVPVLLVTGPVGVGKSSVAAAASYLLREAGVPHALVDLAGIGAAWPVADDDPWNERLTHRNLACMWANFRDADAGRLILARVLEHRSLLRPIMEAVPGAAITVVRLRAPLGVVQARIRHREAGDPGWFQRRRAHRGGAGTRQRRGSPGGLPGPHRAGGRAGGAPPGRLGGCGRRRVAAPPMATAELWCRGGHGDAASRRGLLHAVRPGHGVAAGPAGTVAVPTLRRHPSASRPSAVRGDRRERHRQEHDRRAAAPPAARLRGLRHRHHPARRGAGLEHLAQHLAAARPRHRLERQRHRAVRPAGARAPGEPARPAWRGSSHEADIVEHQRFAAWLRQQIRPTFDTSALSVDAVADHVAGWVRQTLAGTAPGNAARAAAPSG